MRCDLCDETFANGDEWINHVSDKHDLTQLIRDGMTYRREMGTA